MTEAPMTIGSSVRLSRNTAVILQSVLHTIARLYGAHIVEVPFRDAMRVAGVLPRGIYISVRHSPTSMASSTRSHVENLGRKDDFEFDCRRWILI
jgi:hypothetical protein